MWLIHIENSFSQNGILLFVGHSINNPSDSTTNLSEYQQVLPYGPCQAIGTNICHPCGNYLYHEKMTKCINLSESFTPAWSPDSTAHQDQYLSWTLIQTWFITFKLIIYWIHNIQINNLMNRLVLLSDNTWIDFSITCDNARHSSVYRCWQMFQPYVECNVVKSDIQPLKITPSKSVFTDCVINIHHFTGQHFISYGLFYSMHHYIDCTELHYCTCPHTSWNTYNVLSTPTIRALQKIGWSLDTMIGILLVNYRHQHPK